MAFWIELLITALLVLAGLFAIVGSYGLIRLPDPMTRLHAPTKATTLGIGGVLIASMLWFWATEGRFSAHELLITLFLFLSAPITALFIGKVHLHLRQKPDTLPPTGAACDWATYAPDGPARGVRPAGEAPASETPKT